jgi:hypothetical protein
VRTIEVAVHPLGGDNFKIRLDATNPSVGEAKAEIACVQGTEEARQEFNRVAIRADGGAVREDDAEAEPLDDDGLFLGDGEVVAMAVKELPPLVWRTFAEGFVALSEEGAVATQIMGGLYRPSLATTGVELTEGKHYWEVELLPETIGVGGLVDIGCYLCFDLSYVLMLGILIGISRPNLDPTGFYWSPDSTDGWFMSATNGSLYGNDKEDEDQAGGYEQGDRVGVLLNLGDGSLRFFKNGAQHGPGYEAGSVTGPVVAAVQMHPNDSDLNSSVRLLPNAQQPE